MDYYELVRGPFVWIALSIFFLGSLYRIMFLFVAGRKEKMLYPLQSMKNGFRSILHGVIPFGSTYMRKKPVFTIITLSFHLCLIIMPIFLLAHIVLWYESWKILWWSLPDGLADIMAILVVLSCIFFFVRRLVVPEVKNVSYLSDFLLLVIIMAPFLTGFLAYHQWGSYRLILTLHILSGEILLITIPLSKLSHMLFFMFTRGYMGSEFGQALDAQDW